MKCRLMLAWALLLSSATCLLTILADQIFFNQLPSIDPVGIVILVLIVLVNGVRITTSKRLMLPQQ